MRERRKKMKTRVMLLLLAVVVILIPAFATADTANQSKADEKIVVRRGDLPPDLVKTLETRAKLEELGEYAKITAYGKAAGIAVREGLEAVSDTAVKFAATTPGKFTMWMIAFKVLGKTLIQFLVGLPLLFIGTCIFIWSYRRNCITRKEVVEVDEKHEPKKWTMVEGEDTEKWGHVIVYLIFIGICCLIIFT